MRELLIALGISLGIAVLVPGAFSISATADVRDSRSSTAVMSSTQQPSSGPAQRSADPDLHDALDPVAALEAPESVDCGTEQSATTERGPCVTEDAGELAALPAGESRGGVTPSVPSSVDSPETATAGHLPPNEAGQILVLEYHLIGEPGGRWTRTPEEFRADVTRLIAEDYYPINLIDLALGRIDVPLGKSPVVLTFDDSSSGQCRYSPAGMVDEASACGILIDAARTHPEDWRTRATFFVLIEVDVPDRELFGQPEWTQRKLNELVQMGFEIGSHTVSHIPLGGASDETIRKQLAEAEATIERLIPDYEVRSLSLPMGSYPANERLLRSGDWQGQSYDLQAAVEVAGGPSPSPHAAAFDPFHIRRTQVFGGELDYWLDYFGEHPELRYVSDGHPETVAIPLPMTADPAGR